MWELTVATIALAPLTVNPALATGLGACLAAPSYVAVNVANVLATVADVESTFAGIEGDSLRHVHEGNLLITPFVRSGRPATYGLELGITLFVAWKSCDWRNSSNAWVSQNWYVIPAIMTVGHGLAFGLNMRFVH